MSVLANPVPPTPPPSIEDIVKLLDHLYLQPRPDILTLSLYEKRYQTANQQRAVAFILEQNRHLINTSRDYAQIGLCCFHAGLIHRRWGHHLNAAHIFNDARLYWSLANEQPYICLAWFAQAAAQHEGLQFESALINYEKAQRLLPRLGQLIRLQITGRQALKISAFSAKIAQLLNDVYQQLRRELWQMSITIAAPPPAQIIIEADNDAASDDSSETDEPSTEAPTIIEVERPRIHTDLRVNAPALNDAANSGVGAATSVTESRRQPLTGRATAAYARRWFTLTDSGQKLLLELDAGDMVLISQAGLQAYPNGELLATTGHVLDAIHLRPQNSGAQDETYCLGMYKGTSESGAWVLFNNDRAAEAVPAEAIVGHVITNWRNISK